MARRTRTIVGVGQPTIQNRLMAGQLRPSKLSDARLNRRLEQEAVAADNESVTIRNKAFTEKLEQEPVVQDLRRRAAQGDKFAALELMAVRPNEAIQIHNMVGQMNSSQLEQQRVAAEQKFASMIPELQTATGERKKQIMLQAAKAGYLGEVLKQAQAQQGFGVATPGAQIFNKETGAVANTVPKSDPKQTPVTFGAGIVGASQEILLGLAQKQDRGEPLTAHDRMRMEFAKANLEQERTTFRQGPGGETLSITTKPELPPSVQERFGSEQSSGPEVEAITSPKEDKKVKAERDKTVKKMKAAQRKSLELAKFVSDNPDVVGLVGQGKKIGSAITGAINQLVPGDPLPVSSTTRRFERNLILLQSDLRDLIDKGRFSDEDRKRLEALAGGTDWMSSPQSVLEGFEDIGRFTQQVIDDSSPKDGIMAQAEEQARLNNWSEEEKQRFADLLRSQNGNP